jgi:hypothetical protein
MAEIFSCGWNNLWASLSCSKQPPIDVNELQRKHNLEFAEFVVPPKMDTVPCYSADPRQALAGVPIRTGRILLVRSASLQFEGRLSLHINGFSFCADDPEIGESQCAVSPFFCIRLVRFETNNDDTVKLFSVGLKSSHVNVRYSFGCIKDGKRDSALIRSEWVTDFAHVIRAVSQSLLPPRSMATRPTFPHANAHQRLLAGHLIYGSDSLHLLTVPFCELLAGETYEFIAYQNEQCTHKILHVEMTDETAVDCTVGISSTWFTIDAHNFAAWSTGDRRVWSRALLNVKTKLRYGAPAPTTEDVSTCTFAHTNTGGVHVDAQLCVLE